MELSEFLNDFVVSALFCLDLKNPDHIRTIEPNIELNLEAIHSKFFSTNAAILLAAQLQQDPQTLAENLIPIFEIEPFVTKASADEAGNIVIELNVPEKPV